MVDSLFVIFSALFIIDSAHAQVSAPNCSDSSYGWSFNSLGHSPCLVVAYLAAVCNNGSFVIPTLLPQNSYTGPSGPDNNDICKCNTVAYNLISACDACQGEPWIPYTSWTQNCTKVATPGTFPVSIPAETRVPKWAYLDPTPGDKWNFTTALLAGDSPEVTGTGSLPIVPTSVQGSQSTITPTPTSSSEVSSAPQSSSSKTGRIAGGVVGGVIGATLIAGVVTWCTVRRRRARSVRSATDVSDQHGDKDQGAAPRLPTIEALRLYNPSDPNTYPRSTPSLELYQANQNNQNRRSASDLQPLRQAYKGLPEI